MRTPSLRRLAGRAAPAFVLVLSVHAAVAQVSTWEAWDEKWPVSTSITPANAAALYLQSGYGKLDELATGRLATLLNDPLAQAKLSARAFEPLQKIRNDPGLSTDEKAKRFIAAIEADIDGPAAAPVGPLDVKVAFAGAFDVVRLSWERRTQRLACRKLSCSAGPASCTVATDIVDVEPRYQVHRNGKLLATYAEQRGLVTGQSGGVAFSLPGIGAALGGVLPSGAFDGNRSVGPFYDYDAYNRPVGDALAYRVTATSPGCGSGYDNRFTGLINTESTVQVDRNGDGRPDHYPAELLADKRQVGPALGRKVGEHTDRSGKVTIAVFERSAPTAASRFDDFAVAVPPGYVVIGGGAEGQASPSGHLLTASYPNGDLADWRISTRNRGDAALSAPKAWAIGLKLAGLTRQQVFESIVLTLATAPPRPVQFFDPGMPPDYWLLGGGFVANWPGTVPGQSGAGGGTGASALASYPQLQTWVSGSTSPDVANPAILLAYVIGIRREIPGFGTLSTSVQQAVSAIAAQPSAGVSVAPGYALAACGARVNGAGAANVLSKIKPLGRRTQRGCELASTGLDASSTASITAYALGLAAD